VVSSCPNCAFTERRGRRGGRLLTFIAVGSTMLTGCACYGLPAQCSGTKLPDGGLIGGSPTLPLCTDCTQVADPSALPECMTAPADGGTDGGP